MLSPGHLLLLSLVELSISVTNLKVRVRERCLSLLSTQCEGDVSSAIELSHRLSLDVVALKKVDGLRLQNMNITFFWGRTKRFVPSRQPLKNKTP
ncbi:hypothetical protein WJX82_001943 [Trebouxia sp. C0006]